MHDSIQTHSILDWIVGVFKSHGVMMVILHHWFQFQPSLSIYNTCDETLERPSCCGMHDSIQTHSILVWKSGTGQDKFLMQQLKNKLWWPFLTPTPNSSLNHVQSFITKTLEWSNSIRILNARYNPDTLNLGVKNRGLQLKLSPLPIIWLMVMFIHHWLISTNTNHLSYHTFNETLEVLCCCGMHDLIQTHSILMWKVGTGQGKFVPVSHVSKQVARTISYSKIQPSIITI